MGTQMDRITEMDSCYLHLQDAVQRMPERICMTPELQALREKLTDYLKSGLWLADYTSDENGELPASLRRGVLSQDGLYDLLKTLDELEKETLG